MSGMVKKRKNSPWVDAVVANIERRLADLCQAGNRMSDRQLCADAGLRPDAIYSMRRGHSPDAATLVALARRLGVTVEYLATGSPAAVNDPFDESRVIKAVQAVFSVQKAANFTADPTDFSLILMHFLRQPEIPGPQDAAKFALEAIKRNSHR
jgi:transcriptional regulator with XRE-family HTH domain